MEPAPYVPFRTFLSAIEGLERGLPSQLDRSLWPSYSGAIRGQLLGAFRFLGLIDKDHCPSMELREMVSKRDSRKVLLRPLLERSYEPLRGIDLARTSPKQFDDAMRQYGLSGATHKKALSFFLQAARFAEIPLSALLRERTRTPTAHKRLAPEPAGTAQTVSRTVRLRSGGSVTVSASFDLFSLFPEDREFVFSLIDRLRNYGAEHQE